MSEYQLTLPDRKKAIAALGDLGAELSESFVGDLLEALWTSHESGALPDDIVVVLRDWLARSAFDASPVFNARLARARRNGSSSTT
jgi:hypothetical protein